MNYIKLLPLIIMLCNACAKEESYIPSVSVKEEWSLSHPWLSALNNTGTSVVVPGGVAGIIIYRTASGGYMAFDRCSTVNPAKKCAVVANGTSIATDPCSGANYSLANNGSSGKAPAITPLKRYYVSVDEFSITITN